MSSNVNGPEGRETIEDPRTTTSWGTATDPTRSGSRIGRAAIPALRQETPGWYATVICRNANCRRDWVRSVHPEGPCQDGRSCDVPTGTTVHSEDEVAGSSGAVVVFERRFQRRGPKSSCRSPGAGSVGEHGIAVETEQYRLGCEDMQIAMSGPNLQRTSGGTNQVVCIGRIGVNSVSWRSKTVSGIDTELARGLVEAEVVG